MSKNSRAVFLLFAILVVTAMMSNPAMAGKKKVKNTDDLLHGHLYEPAKPIDPPSQPLEAIDTEVVTPPTKADTAKPDVTANVSKAKEARPAVYPVNGVDKLVLRNLFE